MTQPITCRCGLVRLEVTGTPILSCECACTSCRRAAEVIASLERAPERPAFTHYVLYRKDRVQCLSGANVMAEFRLTPTSKTRRVVAACCNTLVFVELKSGHWLSLSAELWPDATRPAIELRTMTSDVPPEVTLPNDVPNHRRQSMRFMMKLLGAWIAMGFRVPALDYVSGGTLDVRR